MKKSSILQKLAVLLFASLVLMGLLTSALYSFLAKPLFIQNKKQELLPQAQWIARQFALQNTDRDSSYISQINNIVSVSYNFYGVFTFIMGNQGIIAATDLPETWTEELKVQVQEDLIRLNDEVKSGGMFEQFYFAEKTALHDEFLYVISPVEIKTEALPVGSVILLQPISELSASVKSLNVSLFLASLIVALILVIPMLLAMRHLIKPISDLREMALAITAGDFSKRSEASGDSEITDLSNAMNHMASRLNSSFNALNHERKRLAAIIEGIREGIIALDANGEVTHFNSVIWDLFGKDPELISPSDFLRITGLNDSIAKCLETASEQNIKIDLEHAILAVQISPLLDPEQNLYGAVCLCHDSTESERLEQTRRDYVANISHELRAPLTSMRALLEPLADGMVHDEATRQRYYGILLRENLRLSRLINDMLELSRVQSGKAQIPMGPVALGPLLRDISLRFEALAQDIGLHLKLDLPEGPIPAVWTNPDRLEQILYILYDNALKFSPDEGLITLSLELQDNLARISVSDQGLGIKAQDLPFVFERFYKADKAHNEVGTGLGLSIAEEITDKMHGRLTVQSDYGHGATFRLDLPYAQDVLRSEAYLVDVMGFDAGPSSDGSEAEDGPKEKTKKRKFSNWKRSREDEND